MDTEFFTSVSKLTCWNKPKSYCIWECVSSSIIQQLWTREAEGQHVLPLRFLFILLPLSLSHRYLWDSNSSLNKFLLCHLVAVSIIQLFNLIAMVFYKFLTQPVFKVRTSDASQTLYTISLLGLPSMSFTYILLAWECYWLQWQSCNSRHSGLVRELTLWICVLQVAVVCGVSHVCSVRLLLSLAGVSACPFWTAVWLSPAAFAARWENATTFM